MIAPQKANQFAEAILVEFARHCECQTPDDIRKALEMLISTSARAIEKYAGLSASLEVMNRTTFLLLPAGGRG